MQLHSRRRDAFTASSSSGPSSILSSAHERCKNKNFNARATEPYPSHGEGIWERRRAILVDIGVLIKYKCHGIMVCNRSRHAHRFPRLFFLVLAAIIMHGPGLYVKFEYEDLLEYSKSILAAAVEGIFLLLLISCALREDKAMLGRLQYFIDCGKHISIHYIYMIMSRMLGLWVAGFIISTILSDATYRHMSGNEGLDADEIVDGMASAKENITAQFEYEPVSVITRTAFGIMSFVGSVYIHRKYAESTQDNTPKKQRFRQLCVMGIIVTFMNIQAWYTPVIFAFTSIASNIDFRSSLSSVSRRSMMDNVPWLPIAEVRPNVIYIQHESLSGSLMLNTEEGRASTPFFQDLMHNDENMFVFEHGRTVSGNTIDAMPALMTGCLPINDDGLKYVLSQGQSIGYDFHRSGYATASFSSRAFDKSITNGKYKRLHDLLAGAMNRVYDPKSEGLSQDNAQGCDDRKLLPHFADWLAEWSNVTSPEEHKPFYAQFYNFNQHFPYLQDPKKRDKARYFNSLKSTDEFLQSIFDTLASIGQLENTIIVGSSDHGEDPFKSNYVRLSALNSNILHATSYIYYPENLRRDTDIGQRLRANTQQLVHTLDMFPTIQSILHGGYDYWANKEHTGCATGVDLTAVDIPDDRVTISQNLASSLGVRRGEPPRYWALETKDNALYYRLGRSVMKNLRQGRDHAYVLIFGICTKNYKNMCSEELSEADKVHFRQVLQSLMSSTLVEDEVKNSELVTFFHDMIKDEDEDEFLEEDDSDMEQYDLIKQMTSNETASIDQRRAKNREKRRKERREMLTQKRRKERREIMRRMKGD